jgi:heme o synthase
LGYAAVHPRSTLAVTASDLAELFKIRVNMLVVLTALCGAYLQHRHLSLITLLCVFFGVGAVAAGAGVLNQWLERDVDARMHRTSRRPLVTGHVSALFAVMLATALTAFGVLYLFVAANLLSAILALLTCLIYVLIYTPSKKLGPWCTTSGAFAGAMPVVIGWCAAGGVLDVHAALLFTVLYLWQFPHFHAIALMYREDYRRAGIQMLAVVDRSGQLIARKISCYSALLFCVSVLPYAIHLSGRVYLVVSALAGSWMMRDSFRLSAALRARQDVSFLSRTLLRTTVMYLPMVLIALATDAR